VSAHQQRFVALSVQLGGGFNPQQAIAGIQKTAEIDPHLLQALNGLRQQGPLGQGNRDGWAVGTAIQHLFQDLLHLLHLSDTSV